MNLILTIIVRLGNPGKHIHNFLQHFSKCKDELIGPADYLAYAEQVASGKDAVDSGEKDRLQRNCKRISYIQSAAPGYGIARFW